MNHVRIGQRTIVLLSAVSIIALFAAGCDSSKKIESLQKENQTLSHRVAELEGQLQQKDAALSAQPAQAAAVQPQATQPVEVKDTAVSTAVSATPPSQAGHSVYTVKEGDNLWKIAKKQLGNGTRYKEILTLNPHITKDKPLVVGSKLTLPAR
jgi:nucleoid-associated protein YgaU